MEDEQGVYRVKNIQNKGNYIKPEGIAKLVMTVKVSPKDYHKGLCVA